MRGGRQGVDPDGLGRVPSVSATRRGLLTGRSADDGRDQRSDCSRRHAGPAWRGSARGSGSPADSQTPWVSSGGEWQGAQSGQSGAELVLPGPALGKMKGEAACLAGEPSGQGEEASPEGLGGCRRLAQTDARGPAGQVVSHDLDGQPGAVGGEASRGEMVEPHAVLQVADGILDLGVAAMVSLEIQGVAVPVGDAAVIAVAGKQGKLGAGRGLDPPDDEPNRCGAGLATERDIRGFGHVGGALHPVRNGRPFRLGYGLDDVAQLGVLADGDGEADIQLSADGDHGVGVEPAVGPHGEWSGGSGVAYPPHGLAQEVSRAPRRVGATFAQACHQHVPSASGYSEERVIAPLAGVVVALRTLLGQPKGLAEGGVQVDGQRPVAGVKDGEKMYRVGGPIADSGG